MKLPAPSLLLLAAQLLSFLLNAQTEASTPSDTTFLMQEIPRNWGFYLHSDQDIFQKSYNEDRNYTMGISLGVFGDFADKNKLGLPWVRRKIDGWLGFD